MDSDPQIPLNSSDLADPDNNPAHGIQVPGAKVRLSSLRLEDSIDGAKEGRLERNGSLPMDFYDAGEDLEVRNEDTLPAAAMARKALPKGKLRGLRYRRWAGRRRPAPSAVVTQVRGEAATPIADCGGGR